MGYTGYKTYYPINYEEDPWVAGDWKYSRTHNIIFWIATIIQGYILWVVILKPELIISNSEVLLDSVVKITRIYTIDEKIMYLYNYFEYHITHTGLTVKDQEDLRYILRNIDYTNIIKINDTTTLKEVVEKIKEFIQTEYYNNNADVKAVKEFVKGAEELMIEPFRNPGDFTLDVEATAYANQPHVKAKLDVMKAHADQFQGTPYRASDYLSENATNTAKEESVTPEKNNTNEDAT
jgi:hypothetical protein